jgi:hypothetical protein
MQRCLEIRCDWSLYERFQVQGLAYFWFGELCTSVKHFRDRIFVEPAVSSQIAVDQQEYFVKIPLQTGHRFR